MSYYYPSSLPLNIQDIELLNINPLKITNLMDRTPKDCFVYCHSTNKYVVELEMAGYSKEDTKIELSCNKLLSSLKVKSSKKSCSFSFGKEMTLSYDKTINIPSDLNHNSIKAKMYNGMLVITAEQLNNKSESRYITIE